MRGSLNGTFLQLLNHCRNFVSHAVLTSRITEIHHYSSFIITVSSERKADKCKNTSLCLKESIVLNYNMLVRRHSKRSFLKVPLCYMFCQNVVIMCLFLKGFCQYIIIQVIFPSTVILSIWCHMGVFYWKGFVKILSYKLLFLQGWFILQCFVNMLSTLISLHNYSVVKSKCSITTA